MLVVIVVEAATRNLNWVIAAVVCCGLVYVVFGVILLIRAGRKDLLREIFYR